MVDVEMMNLPFHKNDLVPKKRLDRGLFIFMTVIIPFIAVWETFIVVHYHPDLNFTAICHFALEVFLLVNIVGNLYYLKRIDISGKQRNLPAVLKKGWRYCHTCQLNSPPRSYHCPVCEECVLKRDKHCMFAGCCVGFHNHRYYMLAVFYIWTGALYFSFYQLQYFGYIVGGVSLSTFLKLTAPHLAVVTGFLSPHGFIVALSQIILFLSTILTSYLLFQQSLCILNGQTTHERAERISPYNLGIYRNFVQVFGKQWYLAVWIPFSASYIPGDGVYFVTSSELEDVKDI